MITIKGKRNDKEKARERESQVAVRVNQKEEMKWRSGREVR